VELEEHRPQFAAQGLGICTISYDSIEVLAHFAARKGITFPMLSDPNSEIIRQFGIFNDTISETDARQYGIPHPGTFLVDEQGIVRHKFFEEKYVHRVTMASILAHGLGLAPAARASSVQADHATVTITATEDRIRPGNRFTLIVDVAPAPGAHLYAPGAERYGYHPLALTIEPPPNATVYPARLPATETIEFPTIGESVPAYTRAVRILADVALGSRQDLAEALAAGSLTIRGRLALQVCDEAECYPPQEIPVTWEMILEPMDTERVPEGMRREATAGPR
jgi:hypothetical protein